MAEANNPAARLHRILTQAKGLANQKALSAWSKLLSVPADNCADLVRRLGIVLSLPADIREQIECIPEIDTEVYLKWIPEVENGFSSLNLSRSFQEFTNPISDKALHGIEFCSEILARTFPDKILNKTELESLDADVLSLIDRVVDIPMDNHAQKFILDKLYLVHQAIQDYDLVGPKPLGVAVQATIGAAIFDQKVRADINQSEVKGDFWGVIYRAAMIVTIIAGTAQIASSVSKLLPELCEAETQILENARIVEPEDGQVSSEGAQNAPAKQPSS